MTINILKIPDQYFFVWDRKRHEAALDGLKIVERMKSEDTEESRNRLHGLLVPSVGFREAEKLRDSRPENVRDALEPVRERQIQMKAYLEKRFEEARKKADNKRPEDFNQKELARGAVFYTMSRSCLVTISETLLGSSDWEKIAGEVSIGSSLSSYLPRDVTDVVRNVLPYAIVFNKRRQELRERLYSLGMNSEGLDILNSLLPKTWEPDMPEEQRQEIERLLESCIRGEVDLNQRIDEIGKKFNVDAKDLKKKVRNVIKGSVRLAKSLNGLEYGKVDEGILGPGYKAAADWFGIGKEVSALGLNEYDIDHVHTKILRYGNRIQNWLSGDQGLSTQLLEHFGIEDVTSWHTSQLPILDPRINPDDETLGLYVGHFLFGSTSQTRTGFSYSPKTKTREWFLDLLEKSGKLERGTYIQSMTSGMIAKRFDRESKNPDKVIEIYRLPTQFVKLAEYALGNCSSQEFYRAALRAWLEDRAFVRDKGCSAIMKPEYEGVIREFSNRTGLSVSNGWDHYKKKMACVKNLDSVGYVYQDRL